MTAWLRYSFLVKHLHYCDEVQRIALQQKAPCLSFSIAQMVKCYYLKVLRKPSAKDVGL